MKKIYLKEESLRDNKEELLLPKFIYRAVMKGNTPIGGNSSLPDSDSHDFEYRMLKSRMSDIYASLGKFGYDGKSSEELKTELSRLLTECAELEKPVRPFLEKLCFNTLVKMFDIPSEIMTIDCKLVDKVKLSSKVSVKPDDSLTSDYMFEDSDEADEMKKEIEKRMMINTLIQGASYALSNKHDLYYEGLRSVNRKLSWYYNRINVINDYLTFMEKADITDKNPRQGSTVEVTVGTNMDKATVTAQGVIFPLLLRESIRGMLELFSYHSLPSDVDKARYIVNKSDFLLAEPWNMRFGIPMWERIERFFSDTKLFPYSFMIFTEAPEDEFSRVLKNMFLRTKNSLRFASRLADEASEMKDYFGFKEKMDMKRLDKTLIGDSYFSADELDTVSIDSDDEGEIIEGV